MQRTFECKTVPCCRELARQSKTIQEHFEFVVPDVNEDIGRICFASAQLCLKGKEITSHGVILSASADICVYYIGESRNCMQCVSTVRELSLDVDCQLPDCDVTAQTALSCRSIQIRAVNPRKIAAEMNVGVELCCYCADETAACVTSPEELPTGLQLLEKNAESILVSSAAEKPFVINEQLTLPAEGAAAVRILQTRVELRHTETQMIGSKALIKGLADLSLSYISEGAAYPSYYEKSVPFSALADADGEESLIGDVTLQPTAVYADLTEAANSEKIVGIELRAVAELTFLKKQKIEYVCDAYSTRCPVEYETAKTRVCTGREEIHLRASAREKFATDAGAGKILSRSAEVLSWSAKDGRLTASVSLSVAYLSEDGMISSLQKMISVETDEPSGGFETAFVSVAGIKADTENGSVAADVELDFALRRIEYADITFLTSVELEENDAYDTSQLPALTVVERTDNDLWLLAKEYHSSVEAIERLDEELSHPPEILLIPRA